MQSPSNADSKNDSSELNTHEKAVSETSASEITVPETSDLSNDAEKLFWVGIGASAGGLEALKAFIAHLPKKPTQNITYIVAQHLSPKHQSMLAQLLDRDTALRVEDLKDGQLPEPNVIYITPPDRDVFVEQGVLQLRAPMSDISPKPCVDFFLTTLAEDQKENAIAVILSGTGSDGAHGVRAIRAAGGMSLVQDIKTAKFDGMPSSAIETGCVDVVLPVEKMGDQIAAIIDSPHNLDVLKQETGRTDIQELLFFLQQRVGIDFKDYKIGTLYRRINRRMAACSMPDLESYLVYVQGNLSELDALCADILISVTNFFRDADAFKAIEKNIVDLIKRKKPGDPIRVWVPGCATGEEAYSLVILFAEAVGGLANLREYHFQLFASDVSRHDLTHGRKGIYAESILESVSAQLREKYFRSRDGGYEVVKGLRDLVVFSKHNVFEDPPFLRLDLISCRNLLIYFNSKLQSTVMNLFHYALRPGATLFLGKSESLGHSTSLFQPVDNKAKIFKRKIISENDRERIPRSSYTAAKRIEIPPAETNDRVNHSFPDALIQLFSPDSLLVDENMDVVRVYGDVQAYTQLSSGSMSMNLMSLAKKELRQELRALIYKVLRDNTSETVLPKKIKVSGKDQYIQIVIRPIAIENTPESLILVSFEKIKKSQKSPKKNDESTENNTAVVELEQELTTTREHLQTVVEELEASNEELQSTNEELQSSNEELQSSNEELETSNEELQSSNEELLTVNDELQLKSQELTASNEVLNNVKNSFDFPLVVVAKDLKVKLYNEAAKSVFMLEGFDKNDAITSIATRIDIPELRRNILAVIKKGKVFSRPLQDGDTYYMERLIPHKNADGNIDGAVLTYMDTTDLRQVEVQLEESRVRHQMIVDGSSIGLWEWQIDNNELYCSPRLLELLKVDEKDFTPEFHFLEERIHPEDRDNVVMALKIYLARGADFDLECRIRTGAPLKSGAKNKDVEYIWAHLCGKAIWDKESNAERISGSLNDVTDRRMMIDQLRDSNQTLGRFAYICSHDLKEPARLAHNFSEILLKNYKDRPLDDEGQGYLRHVTESTDRIQHMIRDMLIYSQIEHRSASPENVDCTEEIKKVLQNLALLVEEKKAIVTYGEMPVIKANRMQIFQLFQNLIGNGLKFSKARVPKVNIAVKERRSDWCFSVKDNGIGINPKHTTQIFDVFQRLNKSEDYSGTGIGLSICQKVVSEHGGEIWVESALDKGSTFFFTIPKKIRSFGR